MLKKFFTKSVIHFLSSLEADQSSSVNRNTASADIPGSITAQESCHHSDIHRVSDHFCRNASQNFSKSLGITVGCLMEHGGIDPSGCNGIGTEEIF